MKKGLIRTLIFEYIEEKNIINPQQVFDNLPKIYTFLKENELFPDLIPEQLTYVIFVQQANQGFEKAKFKKQFNSTIFTI